MQFPDPDDRLYRAQKAVLRFLESYVRRHRTAEVVVKANNTELFNEIPYETSLAIDYDTRFTALLARARAVVLDTPGTTVIEAAFTDVPLFVLSGRAPWYERPMMLLRKRAVVESDVDVLMERLGRFLETGFYEADSSSREFVDAYDGAGTREAAVARVNRHLARIIR